MSTYSSSRDSASYVTPTHDDSGKPRDLVSGELGGNIPEADATWATSLYQGLAKATAIDLYFRVSGEHRNGRWLRLPEAPAHSSELCEPLRMVLNSIIKHFGLSGASGAREAVSTHTHPFEQGDAFGPSHRISPLKH
jgi:hypothetical protein